MIKILLTYCILFFSIFIEAEEHLWPTGCVGGVQLGHVLAYVCEDNSIKVDGLKYKRGLIKEHFKHFEATYEIVYVIVSVPNGMEPSGHINLLLESLNQSNGKSSAILVERK